jgi:hypothetical protein
VTTKTKISSTSSKVSASQGMMTLTYKLLQEPYKEIPENDIRGLHEQNISEKIVISKVLLFLFQLMFFVE